MLPSEFKNQVRQIKIPRSVKVIDNTAFFASSIESVEFWGEGIGAGAFYRCPFLKDVVLHKDLLVIGQSAFAHSGIETFGMPNSVQWIEKDVFQGCEALKEVTLSSNLEEIPEECFDGCRSLKRIVIPEGVEKIGKYAFRRCESLESVVIPSTVKEIEEGAFWGCSSLKEVILPERLTELPKSLFSECRSLTKVTLPTKVEKIPESLLSGCTSLTQITLPKKITFIDNYAFSRTGITTMKLPQSLEYIGKGVFSGCEELKTMTWIRSPLIRYIPEETFSTCMKLTKIVIPDTVTYIGANAFRQCFALAQLDLPDSLEFIGARAFEGLAIPSIRIPPKVTALEEGTFYRCKKLKTLILPKELAYIGDYCFVGCKALTFFTVPLGVTYIGKNVWAGCCFSTFKMPKNVEYIDPEALNNCDELQNITFDDNSSTPTATFIKGLQGKLKPQRVASAAKQASYREDGFEMSDDSHGGVRIIFSRTAITPDRVVHALLHVGRHKNMTIQIESNVPWISPEAFNVPASVAARVGTITLIVRTSTIAPYAFARCSILAKVTIDKQTQNIDDSAFLGCHSLREIQLGPNIKSIGSLALASTALESLRIPDSVKSLGESALSAIPSLRSLILPRTLTKVPNGLCSLDQSLYQISLPSTLEEIGDHAFDGTMLTRIKIPTSVRKIGRGSFLCERPGYKFVTTVYLPENLDDLQMWSDSFLNSAVVYQGNQKLDWLAERKELLQYEALTGNGPAKTKAVLGASLIRFFFYFSDEVPLMSAALEKMEQEGQLAQFRRIASEQHASLPQKGATNSSKPAQKPVQAQSSAASNSKVSPNKPTTPQKASAPTQPKPKPKAEKKPVPPTPSNPKPKPEGKPSNKPTAAKPAASASTKKPSPQPASSATKQNSAKKTTATDASSEPKLSPSTPLIVEIPGYNPRVHKDLLLKMFQSLPAGLHKLSNDSALYICDNKERMNLENEAKRESINNEFVINADLTGILWSKASKFKTLYAVCLGVECIDRLSFNKVGRCKTPGRVHLFLGFHSDSPSIEENAFTNFKTLYKVNFLDNNIQYLPSKVFTHCTILTDITIPQSVTSVGSGIFTGSSKLETLRLCEELPFDDDNLGKRVGDVSQVTYSEGEEPYVEVDPILYSFLIKQERIRQWLKPVKPSTSASTSAQKQNFPIQEIYRKHELSASSGVALTSAG